MEINSPKAIFIDPQYNRPRAIWRLGIQLAIMIMASFIPAMLVLFIALRQIQPSLEQLTNSVALMEQVNTILAANPLLFLLNTSGTVGSMVLSVGLAGYFLDRRKFTDFGFRLNLNWWLDFGFGLALGALLMALIFGVELAAGWITITGWLRPAASMSFAPALLIFLLTFLGVGFAEELFSRGYHIKNMAEGLRIFPALGQRGAIIAAWLLASAIFGMLHGGNPNATLISNLYLIIAGLFLGLGYLLTGELAISIGLHITWNFFQGNVFGFPVSGLANLPTFIAIEQGGSTAITGGPFGPEAGLIGLAAIALGCVLTVLWVRLRYGRVGLHLPLTTPDLRNPVPADEDEPAAE